MEPASDEEDEAAIRRSARLAEDRLRPVVARGRRVVAAIGIDQYVAWPRLRNAVSDARGALDVFARFGFEQPFEPLLDQQATGAALRRFVADELATLHTDDSLVLFFAGHGHTRTSKLAKGEIKTGYLVPVDGDASTGASSTWVALDAWLDAVARLPPRHILVILDACHSGVALDALIKWRDDGGARPDPLEQLRGRQSRRVITSALDDQRALDSGPVAGHSLFTGCLIEGLTGGLARGGRRFATGSELGLYIQRRVSTYPGARQTPDFGTLALDDRGEIVFELEPAPAPPVIELPPPPPPAPVASRPWGWIAGGATVAAAGIVVAVVLGQGSAPVTAPVPQAPIDAPRKVDPMETLIAKIEQLNPYVQIGGLEVQTHQVTREEYELYRFELDMDAKLGSAPHGGTDLPSSDAIGFVTHKQATAFCEAIRARLPSSDEWERLAGGSWGLDPGNAGTRGPLREWTSTVTREGARVRGMEATMTPEQRAQYLMDEPHHRPVEDPMRERLSSKDIGFRCVR